MSIVCRSDEDDAVIALSCSRGEIRGSPLAGEFALRSVVIAAAVVVGLGTLGAFAFVRLGGALGQLQAIDVTLSSARERALPSSDAAPPRLDEASSATAAERGGEPLADARVTVEETHVPAAAGGDEHIKQWLASDPEFQRAANELLQDPDPQVQHEARRLLRELGASVPDPSAER